MRVHVTISSGDAFDASLYSNPVAADLAARLPLTLTFRDFNSVEKVARLDSPLHLRGVPDRDGPKPGEIGYYGPSQGLVLYYDNVGTWPGTDRTVRLRSRRAAPPAGRIHCATHSLRRGRLTWG